MTCSTLRSTPPLSDTQTLSVTRRGLADRRGHVRAGESEAGGRCPPMTRHRMGGRRREGGHHSGDINAGGGRGGREVTAEDRCTQGGWRLDAGRTLTAEETCTQSISLRLSSSSAIRIGSPKRWYLCGTRPAARSVPRPAASTVNALVASPPQTDGTCFHASTVSGDRYQSRPQPCQAGSLCRHLKSGSRSSEDETPQGQHTHRKERALARQLPPRFGQSQLLHRRPARCGSSSAGEPCLSRAGEPACLVMRCHVLPASQPARQACWQAGG